MIVVNRAYTRMGDDGTTALGNGERRNKYDLRVACYRTVNETNAAIGSVRLHTFDAALNAMLGRIQNDLFDLGADLSSAANGKGPDGARLTITEAQVTRLEAEIDQLDSNLSPCARLSYRAARRRLRICTLPVRSVAALMVEMATLRSRPDVYGVVELAARERLGGVVQADSPTAMLRS